MLLTAPLAALAVGAGFGAQALLRPEPRDRALLEALIARPETTTAAVPDPSAAAATDSFRSGAPQASADMRRGGVGSGGEDLAVPQGGPTLPLEIRVGLLKLSSQPSLSASGPWQLSDRSGTVLRSGNGGSVAYLDLLSQHSELWLQTTLQGRLNADSRSYEGRLRLLRGSGGVRVVNHLPLENYISSVVGGEMPSSWHPEALRAQAVAARSYAMAHMARPANEHWHLGDTTRWQNYEGLGSVSASTRQATATTAGVILSYRGGIVESLYAATQQIVDEAHGHLGASMSQNGAQDLANQGLRFNQILGRYYRGASLARLQAGAR